MKNKLTQAIRTSILASICTVSAVSFASEDNINIDAKKLFTEVGTFTAPKSEYSYYYRDLDGDGAIEQLEINHWKGSFGTNGISNLGFGYAGSDDALTYVILQDINNDGLTDIVGIGNKGVTSILNHGSNFIGNNTVLTKFKGNLKNSADYLKLADIDNDGSDDIIFFYKDNIYLIEGDNGSFSTKWKKISGKFNISKYKHIEIADVNYDGYPDLVGLNNKTVDVAINSQSNGFQAVASWLHSKAPNKEPFSIKVVDINQDGYADLITFHQVGIVNVAENMSGYSFNLYKQIATKFYGYRQQSVADVNNDGKSDIVGLATNKEGKSILMVALNSAKGFGNTQFYYAPIKDFAEYDLKLKQYPLRTSKNK
ncbi:FG-GAP repeat domain-containing protein [Spartinivicinus ruber]|uniref:FG-GAP repeat domain-containing protein n=1 Tax=Spartinivicinus ruber TaxID=2683272 RepID=UPI0013D054BA|nr:VCBS repeat-containing protein [Spartinivicinus ruber]